MKRNSIINILLLIIVVALVSCQGETMNAGASALENEDQIRVKADTFSVVSALEKSSAISFSPDSFLLGECDTHYGTIKADLLTQMVCPVGFEYPDSITVAGRKVATNPTVDSMYLYLYYENWYGDGMAPLGITVHEMDRATLDYDTRYPNDTCLSTFCSLDDTTRIAEQMRIVYAQQPTDSIYMSDDYYMPCVRVKLSDAFAKRFFAIKDFSSQEAFNQLFKGLYISTSFGGSTVLYVKEISMAVFYHFSYPRAESADSVVNDLKMFYVNSEVRQINRYIYPDRDAVLEELNQSDMDYVISPANIYTRLSVDVDSVFNRITQQLGESDDYRVYMNRANLTVDVLYEESSSERPRDQWDLPAAQMLLIREDKMDRFFTKNELPSDTVAVLSSLSTNVDSLSNVSYYYSFDLSGLFTHLLRTQQQQGQLHFMLVPVSVQTASSSSTILSVRPLQTISATHIRSAEDTDYPMDIEMLYSGFNNPR